MKTNLIIEAINASLKKRNYTNIKITIDNIDLPIREIKIDSLLALGIVTDLEQRFGVQLTDEELLSIKTPKDLINLFLLKSN